MPDGTNKNIIMKLNISDTDFLDALDSTIPQNTDTVFILSRIWSFANRIDLPIEEIGAWLFDLIDEFIGPDRTLIYPAFTFSYGKTRRFDIIRSQPETGILPQIALLRSTFRRTNAPMASYLVRGPRQEEALSLQCTTTCGDDGMLGWFLSNNTLICAIGLEETNMGWCMVHYSEENLGVPYRYFKKMPGQFYIDGIKSGTCADIHYVNPLNINLRQDNSSLNHELKRSKLIMESPLENVPIRSVGAGDVVNIANQLLNNDPFTFIINKDDARHWIQSDKGNEISELKAEERWKN